MCTSNRCLECDGTPLRTGECIPQACTVAFPIEVWPGVMICPKCGWEGGVPGWKYCPLCGSPLEVQPHRGK
jgi:hypothetical protein